MVSEQLRRACRVTRTSALDVSLQNRRVLELISWKFSVLVPLLSLDAIKALTESCNTQLNMKATPQAGAQTSRYNHLVTVFVALGSFVNTSQLFPYVHSSSNSQADIWILRQRHRVYNRAARLVRVFLAPTSRRARLQW
jgi:hypothetical protein